MDIHDYVIARQDDNSVFQKYCVFIYEKITEPSSIRFEDLLSNSDLQVEIKMLTKAFISLEQRKDYIINALDLFCSSRYSSVGLFGYRGINRKNGQMYLVHILFMLATFAMSPEADHSAQVVDTMIAHDLIEEAVVRQHKGKQRETISLTGLTEEEFFSANNVLLIRKSIETFKRVNEESIARAVVHSMEAVTNIPTVYIESVDARYYFEPLSLLWMVVQDGTKPVVLTQLYDRLDALLNVGYVLNNPEYSFDQKKRGAKRVLARSIGTRIILESHFPQYSGSYKMFDECAIEMFKIDSIVQLGLEYSDVREFACNVIVPLYEDRSYIVLADLQKYLDSVLI